MFKKMKAVNALLLCGAIAFCTLGNYLYTVEDDTKPVPLPDRRSASVIGGDATGKSWVTSVVASSGTVLTTVPATVSTVDTDGSGELINTGYESGKVYDTVPSTGVTTTDPATTPVTTVTVPVTTTTKPVTTTTKPVTTTTRPVTTTTKPVTTTTRPVTTTTRPVTTTTKPVTTTTRPVTITTRPVTTATKPVTTTTKPATTTTLPVTTVPSTTAPATTAPITTVPSTFPYDPEVVSPSDIQSQGGLLDIDDPYDGYNGGKVSVVGEDRDLLERLVYGEAGNQGFIGVSLVAQCIRDAMLYEGFDTVAELRTAFRYAGSIDKGTSEEVRRAIRFIFDEGGYAVKHPILYFYAPKGEPNYDGFHESQEFVVQYVRSRFFWKKNGTI